MENYNSDSYKGSCRGTGLENKQAVIAVEDIENGGIETIEATHIISTDGGWLHVYEHARTDGITRSLHGSSVIEVARSEGRREELLSAHTHAHDQNQNHTPHSDDDSVDRGDGIEADGGHVIRRDHRECMECGRVIGFDRGFTCAHCEFEDADTKIEPGDRVRYRGREWGVDSVGGAGFVLIRGDESPRSSEVEVETVAFDHPLVDLIDDDGVDRGDGIETDGGMPYHPSLGMVSECSECGFRTTAEFTTCARCESDEDARYDEGDHVRYRGREWVVIQFNGVDFTIGREFRQPVGSDPLLRSVEFNDDRVTLVDEDDETEINLWNDTDDDGVDRGDDILMDGGRDVEDDDDDDEGDGDVVDEFFGDEFTPQVDVEGLENADIGGELIENSDGVVVAREVDGMQAFADSHGDGRFECVVCAARSESKHGSKVHFGKHHEPGDVPDDIEAETDDDDDDDDGEEDDGDVGIRGLENAESTSDTAWTDVADHPDIPSDDDDDDDDGVSWDDVRKTYRETSIQSAPATKSDARDAAVQALEGETEWMSIRERSEATKIYDLQRWDPENGWQADAATFAAELLAEELGAVASDTECKHIISQLARLNPVDQDSINGGDFDETFIPVANGVICVDDIEYDPVSMTIDWDSVELREKKPEHKFLYQIETEWDPDAADVEGLDEWLETIVHSEESRRIIWEFGGHSLHPRYPADGFLMALGRGGSGKSQTLEVIKAMLGGENVAVQSLQKIQQGRFTGQTVVDKRANINTELSGRKISALNKLKVYAAGEEDQVEGKGTPFYKASNDATMLFASDNPPALPSDNRAVGRRLYTVEYPCIYVDDPDPDNPYELQSRSKMVVQEELQAEERLKAALLRSVEGLVRLLHAGDFTANTSWKDRIVRYESYADPIKDFCRVCLNADDDLAIEAGDLKRTCDNFAAAKDHQGRSIQRIKNVLDELPTLPASKSRTRAFADDQDRHTIYKGITFTEKAKENWVPDSAHWHQYGGRDGEYEDSEDGGIDVVSLAEIRAEGPERYDGVRVTVASVEDEPAYYLYDQGVVRDDTETLRYEVQSGISLEEGEEYVIRDVIATKDDADIKLQLVDGMTDVFHIEQRDGDDALVEDDERGDSPEYNDGDADDGDEDDGEDDDRDRDRQEVEEELQRIIKSIAGDGAASKAAVIGRASSRGIDEDEVQDVIHDLLVDGLIWEPADGSGLMAR